MQESPKYKNATLLSLLAVVIITIALSTYIGVNAYKNFGIYEGEDLDIAVLGNIPDVRESNVSFHELKLDDIFNDSSISEFDAILITKDYLKEFGEGKYREQIKNQKVPYVFVESNKAHLPFAFDIPYTEKVSSKQNPYFSMLFMVQGELQYWNSYLYNDKMNKRNVKLAYSLLFSKLETVK